MSKKLATGVIVGLTTAAALLVGPTSTAGAATAPVSHVRIAAHFDLAAGQTPENLALEPDGSVDLSFAVSAQIARLGTDGGLRILATLPAPADGGVNTPLTGQQLTTGLVRAHDGTLYVAYDTGTSDLTGIWRLTPGGTLSRLAALPANSLANGLALDEAAGMLYSTDSALGTIWRVPVCGGTATAWAQGPELAAPAGSFGANGLKVHNGAVWASNMDKGTVIRIPIERDGKAGTPEIKADQLAGIDDFAFIGHSDSLLATLNGPAEVALVQPDGTHSIVLTAQDGLQNPTSVAVWGGMFYVASAAYGGQDPNLLTAHIARHG